MKMKVQKENKRFNVETVVANYCFGTWNIGTLKSKSGEVCEVLCRRKVEVCCIQEVRWKGEGCRALQWYNLIWKGNSEGTAGVGVLVASELADRIIRVERISDRVIAVDLVIGEQIVKVVSCYAPQAGRSQIEKEEFWRQVEGVIMNTDINQEVIVGGDMNGHVGQVANGFHEVHGNFGYGTRNAGERILEFAEAMGYQVEVMKKQAETLDSKEGRQNIFRIAKQKKKERKDITGTNCLKGDSGDLQVSEEQVSDRWREYFEKLLNEENEWNDELSAEYVEEPADMIIKEEVRQAIQDLKVRKAAGPSGVTAEIIKAAGEKAVDWLTSICNRIVKEEAIAESWQMSELVPIYKGKGDVLECSSSRGIKLLEHGMKVAERVLERRLRQAVEIDKMQYMVME